MTDRARRRLIEWLAWRGISQAELARELGCHQTMVSKLLDGARGCGLRFAHRLERASVDWPDGPIRTEEWDPDASMPTADDAVSAITDAVAQLARALQRASGREAAEATLRRVAREMRVTLERIEPRPLAEDDE